MECDQKRRTICRKQPFRTPSNGSGENSKLEYYLPNDIFKFIEILN